MKTIQTACLLSLVGTALFHAPPSLAQSGRSAGDAYYYGGIGAGQSRARIDAGRVASEVIGQGLALSDISRSETDTSYKVFAGYQFNRWFALEAGYFNLGKFDFDASTRPAGSLKGQFKVQGVNLDAVGTWPVTERLSVLGRIGVQYAQTRDSFSSTGAATVRDASPSKKDTNFKYGAGLQYAVSSGFLVRAEAERLRIHDAVGHRNNVDLLSVSLVFPFGRSATAAPRASATPAYAPPLQAQGQPQPMAPMAAPMPAPMQAPQAASPVAPAPALTVSVPPPSRRVSLSAETLFGFDHSDLGEEGKRALETFSREVATTQVDSVVVEGHTDRLGSQSYNQTLSNQRAEVVKSFLIIDGKLDPAKVSAVGKSESTPVTQPGDCVGDKPTPALIACLKRDRRVEIEVKGSR